MRERDELLGRDDEQESQLTSGQFDNCSLMTCQQRDEARKCETKLMKRRKATKEG